MGSQLWKKPCYKCKWIYKNTVYLIEVWRYFGKIGDLLIKERSYKNIRFHSNMVLPTQIHTETGSFDIIVLYSNLCNIDNNLFIAI